MSQNQPIVRKNNCLRKSKRPYIDFRILTQFFKDASKKVELNFPLRHEGEDLGDDEDGKKAQVDVDEGQGVPVVLNKHTKNVDFILYSKD